MCMLRAIGGQPAGCQYKEGADPHLPSGNLQAGKS